MRLLQTQLSMITGLYLTTVSLPLPTDIDDDYVWIAGDSPVREFRASTTWEVMRPREQAKDWVDVIWFKGAVPKHAFTMWVACWDRLPTRERLVSWGMHIAITCPLCSRVPETRDHMLLSCDYSTDVWKEVFIRCLPPSTILTTWAELLSWIRNAGTADLKLLRKVATQAAVFHLWKQRNNVVHNQISIPAATVFVGLDREVRNIISAKRKRKQFSSLMSLWLR
ncbi:uncharacterized protein LOC117131710 [Brassica rapa]|uniref:uncharacterized protein LOC117131710 n=1 Tax=Brassica campestris TaxID=3711 RepID=UPI00142E3D2D|nr:uncharacterized protein LOC117131710 [Brassica rapa]